MQEITGDPQFTTQGAYRQADDITPGPQEGQGGRRIAKRPPKARARRKSVAARRGQDETRRKTGIGRKAKNAGQLRNPKERKARQLGPTGRARAAVGRVPKGKARTAAQGKKGGSPYASRREVNRGKRKHAGGSASRRPGI